MKHPQTWEREQLNAGSAPMQSKSALEKGSSWKGGFGGSRPHISYAGLLTFLPKLRVLTAISTTCNCQACWCDRQGNFGNEAYTPSNWWFPFRGPTSQSPSFRKSLASRLFQVPLKPPDCKPGPCGHFQNWRWLRKKGGAPKIGVTPTWVALENRNMEQHLRFAPPIV